MLSYIPAQYVSSSIFLSVYSKQSWDLKTKIENDIQGGNLRLKFELENVMSIEFYGVK